ncbi:hypothetical protein C8Q80DRAFT_1117030 [Daedaleopsis nitida]|nr:hypothetical protein C8Q80DRAFT_1117030 [Daedaleopsis nitida]
MLSDAQHTFGGPFEPFSREPSSSCSPDTPSIYAGSYGDVGTIGYGPQDLSAPWNGMDAHEGLYYQPLSWELELELSDSYLAYSGNSTGESQNVSDSSYTLATHPSLGSFTTAELFGASLLSSTLQKDTAESMLGCLLTTDNGSTNCDLYSDQTQHQLYLQVPVPVNMSAPSSIVDGETAAPSCITPSGGAFAVDSPATPPHTRRSRSARRPSLPPYPEPHPVDGRLTTFKRRNVQVPSAAATALPAKRNCWKCPFCPYVQRNQRKPDLKRHIETHMSPEESPRWICCGVPVGRAPALGVPDEIAHEEPFEFVGMEMVGGCRKTFSRRDALSRHLRRTRGECYGDAFATYQPGN